METLEMHISTFQWIECWPSIKAFKISCGDGKETEKRSVERNMKALEVAQIMDKPESDKSFASIKIVLDNKGKQQVGFKKENVLETNRFFFLDYS